MIVVVVSQFICVHPADGGSAGPRGHARQPGSSAKKTG
jgi:hypothetical protein